MENYINQITNFYKEMLDAGTKYGELKEHDTDCRALAIASSLDGVTPYLIMSNDLTDDELADKLIRTFINEIEKPRDND